MAKDFKLIPHTADLQLRVYGSSREELFRHALLGMFQSLKPKNKTCHYEDDRIICPSLPITRACDVESINHETLLIDFLSQALTLSDIYNEVYLDATINTLSDKTIEAILHGIEVKGFEGPEIKAVTYHDLYIKEDNGVWSANIVFDI